MLLDSHRNLTLRPMQYPIFFEMFKAGIRNTWTVEEVDFSADLPDLANKLTSAERHLMQRLVAFFATGDSIVSNNLVLNLYKHINSPEARVYLSRQLYEEAVHVQFYLNLLDNYIPDLAQREEAFRAIDTIPSIQKKAEFCFKWLDDVHDLPDNREKTIGEKKRFLLNLICFATCVEGLFFFAAFAYVYFMRSKGYLNGLASGTDWVFRDESMHMTFALEVAKLIKEEEPYLWDDELEDAVVKMMEEAVDCETQFAVDLLSYGIAGLSALDMRSYLGFIADQRLENLGMKKHFNTRNPFPFMDLQGVQTLINFFERTNSDYQVGIGGGAEQVRFDEKF